MRNFSLVRPLSWFFCCGILAGGCTGTDEREPSATGGTPGVGGSTTTTSTNSTPNVSSGGATSATSAVSATGGTNPDTSPGITTGGTSASTGTASTGTMATGGTTTMATGGTTTMATGGTTTTATGGKASGGTTAAGGTAGAPYRGVANSPCTARTNLKVSWYYNWMQAANEPCSPVNVGGEFVPMISGKNSAEKSATAIASAVATFVGRANKYVLGFNEPDNATQSNITVANAITYWPGFTNPSIKVGSPATQANTTGVAWFKDFNTQLNGNTALQADFIAIHWYGWNAGSCDAKAATLENYIKQIEALPGNRPLWLTEWGCLDKSDDGSAVTTQAHIAGAVAMFANHPRLVRYAWYPWASAAHSLNNSDGSLTTLGAFYASLPAYK